MFGRLYHLPISAARRRADELLGQFALAEAAGEPVRQYSGGMRRRLDLAASFIVTPLLATYAEDAMLVFPGRSSWSGEYRGRAAIEGFFRR